MRRRFATRFHAGYARSRTRLLRQPGQPGSYFLDAGLQLRVGILPQLDEPTVVLGRLLPVSFGFVQLAEALEAGSECGAVAEEAAERRRGRNGALIKRDRRVGLAHRIVDHRELVEAADYARPCLVVTRSERGHGIGLPAVRQGDVPLGPVAPPHRAPNAL